MKKFLNLLEISCPYINFSQDNSGYLPRIKPRNTGTHQRQRAKLKETSSSNSNLESNVSHVFHMVKDGHTQPHLQDFCKSTRTCIRKSMICSQSFWLQLFIITKCTHAQLPSKRLNVGPGTIILPTS